MTLKPGMRVWCHEISQDTQGEIVSVHPAHVTVKWDVDPINPAYRSGNFIMQFLFDGIEHNPWATFGVVS